MRSQGLKTWLRGCATTLPLRAKKKAARRTGRPTLLSRLKWLRGLATSLTCSSMRRDCGGERFYVKRMRQPVLIFPPASKKRRREAVGEIERIARAHGPELDICEKRRRCWLRKDDNLLPETYGTMKAGGKGCHQGRGDKAAGYAGAVAGDG